MTEVLHFAVDGGPAACGAPIYLCSEYTDEPKFVDCKRCRRTKQFRNYDPTRFNVDVWNHEGDVVRWFKSVTADEVDEIRREYEDDPTVSVAVEEA